MHNYRLPKYIAMQNKSANGKRPKPFVKVAMAFIST